MAPPGIRLWMPLLAKGYYFFCTIDPCDRHLIETPKLPSSLTKVATIRLSETLAFLSISIEDHSLIAFHSFLKDPLWTSFHFYISAVILPFVVIFASMLPFSAMYKVAMVKKSVRSEGSAWTSSSIPLFALWRQRYSRKVR
ncbi:hypothetical protein ABVK25_009323 [Lepraria finkii]|uniref:Uncharacterized protein n=1 Tax=Lepraria finkii TaxID=1340010 RepID=A0ABR4AXH8_9LECA